MKLIMCVDENWGIGNDGDLLIKIPEDLKHFQSITEDSVVIMGRKTLDSLPNGKPLKNRVNVVLTRQSPKNSNKNLIYVNTLKDILFLNEIAKACDKRVYIIGGESIIEQLLPYIDSAYITYVRGKFQADKHMPNLDEVDDWKMVSESETKYYYDMEYTYRFYGRK